MTADREDRTEPRPRISAGNVVIGVAVLAAVVVAVAALLNMDTTGRRGAGYGRRFDARMARRRRIDPALLKWVESAKAIRTGMENPRGIAVAAGDRICVVGDRALGVFDSDGREIARHVLTQEPQAVASVDSDGTIYLAMRDHVEVVRRNLVRVGSAWAPLGPKAMLTSIAVSDKYVFVADAGNRVVRRFDKTGREVFRGGDPACGPFASGFIVPSPHMDVAVEPDGRVITVNPGKHSVQVRDGEGTLITAWGRYGADAEGLAGCCNPVAIARLPDGRIVTAEKGIKRVKVYTPRGKLESVVAGPDRFTGDGVLDVAADSSGRILVLDPDRRQVRIFTRKGKQAATAGAER